MKRPHFAAALVFVFVFVGGGCVSTTTLPGNEGVSTFVVSVVGIYRADGSRTPHAVVTECNAQHGNNVPDKVRGTAACPYAIPRGEVDVELKVEALNTKSERMPFNGTVSFRSVPGDLTTDYPYRFGYMKDGDLTFTTRVAHLYGEARFWVEDAPPEILYDDGVPRPFLLENEDDRTRVRTYATGASPIVYFEDPTLAKVQIPDDKRGVGFDNRSSPFVGQFMVIGRNPESGSVTTQTCADLLPDGTPQPQDGQPAMLVVTGTDTTGFFVTDITSCRVREVQEDSMGSTVRVPEPDGYSPGTYGSMFVYNYSYPEGLEPGDLLWTLSGAVQEFTSTTQLTFPSWSVRERVRLLPPPEWNKYLDLVKPVELNARICGLDNQAAPFLTDPLCGHNRRNLKLESVESGLVKVRHVRFPDLFVNCDANADGTVPFFCEGTRPVEPQVSCERAADCAFGLTCDRNTQVCAAWGFQDCDFESTEPAADFAEMQCNIDCVIGYGPYAGKRCAEAATYNGFGQYVVEMNPPGPADAGFDASLPARFSEVTLSGSSQLFALPFAPGVTLPASGGVEVALWCESDARVKAGDASVTATASDIAVPARQRTFVQLQPTQTRLAVIGTGAVAPGAKCFAGYNPRLKINLITKDAVPDLNPDCNPADANTELAEQCRLTRAATYDVTGHLRQLQPGRPRWAILPRDQQDVCCHPGPGLSCPKPLQACPP